MYPFFVFYNSRKSLVWIQKFYDALLHNLFLKHIYYPAYG